MRWPLRRRPQADAAPPASPAAPVRRDWATLPPIEPAIGAAPLIAQRSPGRPGLSGVGPLTRALAPLGHHLRTDAPWGTATGLAAVIAGPREPLPSLRGAGRPRQAPPPGPGEMPVIEPVRVVAATELPADEPSGAVSLIRSPEPAAGATAPPQRLAQGAASVQRLSEPAPTPDVDVAGEAPPIRVRPSLGQSRRLGIGIPFSRTPVQRAGAESAGADGAAVAPPLAIAPLAEPERPAAAAPVAESVREAESGRMAAGRMATPGRAPSPVPGPGELTASEPATTPAAAVRVSTPALPPSESPSPPVALDTNATAPPLTVDRPALGPIPAGRRATPVQRQRRAPVDTTHAPTGTTPSPPLGSLPPPARPDPSRRGASPAIGSPGGAEAPATGVPAAIPGADRQPARRAVEPATPGGVAEEPRTSPPADPAPNPPAPPSPVHTHPAACPPHAQGTALIASAPVIPLTLTPPAGRPLPSATGAAPPPLAAFAVQRSSAPAAVATSPARSPMTGPSPTPGTAAAGASATPGAATAPMTAARTAQTPALPPDRAAAAARPVVARFPIAAWQPPPPPRPAPAAQAPLVGSLPLVQATWSHPPDPAPSTLVTSPPPERGGTAGAAPQAMPPLSGALAPPRPVAVLAAVQRDHRPSPPAPSDPPLRLYAPSGAGATGANPDGGASPGSVVTLPGMTAQRAVDEPAATPPTVQTAAAPAAPGAGGHGGHSEAEMEELARRLYEHIGIRLRAELLVERERAGMVTDLW